MNCKNVRAKFLNKIGYKKKTKLNKNYIKTYSITNLKKYLNFLLKSKHREIFS